MENIKQKIASDITLASYGAASDIVVEELSPILFEATFEMWDGTETVLIIRSIMVPHPKVKGKEFGPWFQIQFGKDTWKVINYASFWEALAIQYSEEARIYRDKYSKLQFPEAGNESKGIQKTDKEKT